MVKTGGRVGKGMKKMKIDKWDAMLIMGWYKCTVSEGYTDYLDEDLADKIEKFESKCFQEDPENE